MAATDYSFRDSDAAARRLDLVSRLFDPASAVLLGSALPPPVGLAVDLGCGPGNTTRLLAQVSGARRIVGVDHSAAFVAAARARHPDLEFLEHDVTIAPFPLQHADAVYARLVLAHLPSIAPTVRLWSTLLAAHGVLVLDEVDDIVTGNDVFAAYLRVVTGMIAARGADMYAGRALGRLDAPQGVRTRRNDVVEVPLPTAAVAEMFGLNLSVWRDDDWVVEHHAALVDELAARLAELTASTRDDEIVWRLRQVVLARQV